MIITMKKQYIFKKIFRLLFYFIIITTIFDSCGDENFWGIQSNQYKIFEQGNGTQGNPFIVTTPEQLDAVRDNLSACYKLGNNIDLTNYLASGGAGYAKWGADGWDPIIFNGSLDGAGYTITGLWIYRPSIAACGLFSNNTGIVQNLGVEIASGGIIGGDYVGGLAGDVYFGSIINCYVVGNVSGNNYVGGLAGSISGSNISITNCYVISTVNGNNYVGGLVGGVYSSITNSYVSGTVNSNNYAGSLAGIVGGLSYHQYYDGNITNCVVLSQSVKGSNTGRVAGFVSQGTLSNNWARSDMAVTVNGVSKTLNKGNNTEDGADCVAIPVVSWWTTVAPNGPGWNSSVWYFANGQLPVLQWQQQLIS